MLSPFNEMLVESCRDDSVTSSAALSLFGPFMMSLEQIQRCTQLLTPADRQLIQLIQLCVVMRPWCHFRLTLHLSWYCLCTPFYISSSCVWRRGQRHTKPTWKTWWRTQTAASNTVRFWAGPDKRSRDVVKSCVVVVSAVRNDAVISRRDGLQL